MKGQVSGPSLGPRVDWNDNKKYDDFVGQIFSLYLFISMSQKEYFHFYIIAFISRTQSQPTLEYNIYFAEHSKSNPNFR